MADLEQRDRTTLTRNLRPLEAGGLLRVARSPTDARARTVFASAAGERLLEAAFPLWEQAEASAQATVGKGRASALHAELGVALQAFAKKTERKRARHLSSRSRAAKSR